MRRKRADGALIQCRARADGFAYLELLVGQVQILETKNSRSTHHKILCAIIFKVEEKM